MHIMKNKIEILAPAGSYEGMRAAMNAGCDAVYIGGSSFGARAYANNLDEDTLLHAIDEAHTRDKKLYLTVNTLLKEKELRDKLYHYLERFYLQGLDAVIVQDVGVMHFIHKHFPQLPIHASTQMTLTMAQGANLLKDSGVTRIVTSRELSLKEIKKISENTDLEIETFVHGALCYCYSGQCLMSSIIGGRSGNRGRCAQPCRMPYSYYTDQKKLSSGEEKYLLSPKDINTIELIPELVQSGIHSFKIEGRMKRPEYAAAVSNLYRKYTDLYFELGNEGYQKILTGDMFRQDMIMLQDVYNRGGFSSGYGKNYHGKNMMSLYRPNHSGVYVGKVSQIKGSQVTIKLTEDINAQDILEIRHTQEEGYDFTVKDSHHSGEVLVTNVGRRFDKSKREKGSRNPEAGRLPVMSVGDMVYRTKNNALLENLSRNYVNDDKRIGIKGRLTAKIGHRLKLTVSYQNFSASEYKEVVQEAMKQPMTKEKLETPLMKTGDTLFYFEELQIDLEDNIFVPVAWLNEIRREAISSLEQNIIHSYRRNQDTLINADQILEQTAYKVNSLPSNYPYQVSVTVQSLQQFHKVLQVPEVNRIYAEYDFLTMDSILEMSKQSSLGGKQFYLALPHICRQTVYDRLKEEINGIIESDHIAGYVVKNFEEIELIRSLLINSGSTKNLILDHNMYIFNREAKDFWRETGITRMTAPLELNYQELKQLGIEECELLVYGYLPLMISAQCLHESTSGCKKTKNSNKGYLVDRLGKKFLLQTNCPGCYNTIYNGQPTSLHKYQSEIKNLNPSSIRIDFTFESEEEVAAVMQCMTDTFCHGLQPNDNTIGEYTTGHFKRGVE